MKITFSGTQDGMTTGQIHKLRSFLLEHLTEITEFHHGCCVGADTQAHYEAYNLNIPMHYHPCNIFDKQSDLREFKGKWYPVEKPLVRNRIMVGMTDVLILGPKSNEEVLRSGTWATYRYAKSLERQVELLKR